MQKIFTYSLLFLMPLSLCAQFKAQTKPIPISDRLQSAQPRLGILGLDPERFTMQHSYSMSYASIGGRGFTQGLYLNTMSYQFAFPMTLSLQVGMAHNPLQSANTASILQNGFFLSGAQLRYQPTKNTVLQVNFQQRPYNRFGGYYGMYNDGLFGRETDWFE